GLAQFLDRLPQLCLLLSFRALVRINCLAVERVAGHATRAAFRRMTARRVVLPLRTAFLAGAIRPEIIHTPPRRRCIVRFLVAPDQRSGPKIRVARQKQGSLLVILVPQEEIGKRQIALIAHAADARVALSADLTLLVEREIRKPVNDAVLRIVMPVGLALGL